MSTDKDLYTNVYSPFIIARRPSLLAQTVKKTACNVEHLDSILGRLPGDRKGYPLQYSGLETSMEELVGYSPWVRKEWDMTERVSLSIAIN